MWRSPRPASPNCSSTSDTSRRSDSVAHGRRIDGGRDISTTSLTVIGKFQFTVSTCGTYATRRLGSRFTVPFVGERLPRMSRSRVVLPEPDGPMTPRNEPASIERWM